MRCSRAIATIRSYLTDHSHLSRDSSENRPVAVNIRGPIVSAFRMPVTTSNEQFIELFARSQRRIYSYIATLLPNSSDVEEVFQQTCLVLWRDRERFIADLDFVRWGCGIAHNRVRNFLRLRHRK